MARVIPIGSPVNEGERRAIAHLRDVLPDDYTLIHNFELKRGQQCFEIDIALIAPHAVFVVDVKGTRGSIEVQGSKWYPEGRRPFQSPLPKLREHAKAIKGLLTDANPTNRDLERVCVVEAAVLCAPDAYLVDPRDKDADRVCTLKKSAAFFASKSLLPNWANADIRAFHKLLIKTIAGEARPRTGPLVLGNWEVIERIGSNDLYTEYRACNATTGRRADTVNLRVYQADPYAEPDDRAAQRHRIQNAYEALSKLSPHPNLAGARDFFANEHEDQYILITDDLPGRALQLHLSRTSLALTRDQKWQVALELLDALAHAHAQGVVHRNITPAAIMLGKDGVARLVDFDYARSGPNRTHTIADTISDTLTPQYVAPECFRDAAAASPASDIYSVGIVLYELLTGDRPFASMTEAFDASAKFPAPPSSLADGLPAGFDDWLQSLCSFSPAQRPSSAAAFAQLESLLKGPSPEAPSVDQPTPGVTATPPAREPVDYAKLPSGFELAGKYVVQHPLGKPGSFGVVYKVFDSLADVPRVIKLTLKDRHSVVERFKKEYRILEKLRSSPHKHVVAVVDGNILPGEQIPYLVSEFVDGEELQCFIEKGALSIQESLDFARQVAAGLVHLHHQGIYHCDIKPGNLLWTPTGAKIIDFNVAVMATDPSHGGGSRKYLPADIDLSSPSSDAVKADRDCFALAITLYQAITGNHYPWPGEVPSPATPADPRQYPDCADLSQTLVDVLNQALAPARAQRYPNAEALLAALESVKILRTETAAALQKPTPHAPGSVPIRTTVSGNLYVDYLATLFSQSRLSNRGTRGMDALGLDAYVETALDTRLLPAALRGQFSLVVITGNAGDGKTAFLENLEQAAVQRGATSERSPNGFTFSHKGRAFLANLDGSQDEGDTDNDEVLATFFSPFEGVDSQAWTTLSQTRLIAINEGRLVDFLQKHADRFPALRVIVDSGLRSCQALCGVLVVNLNERSVVAPGLEAEPSIMESLLQRMTAERFWSGCEACELKDKCYALHNARTFQDAKVGPMIARRLYHLYFLTHLRGRMHITLRDLRSALAYTLTSGRRCTEIRRLYAEGEAQTIAASYYFNSWCSAVRPTADRLLSLLGELDMGATSSAHTDRALDFTAPDTDKRLVQPGRRSSYCDAILVKLFGELPRGTGVLAPRERMARHQAYVAMCRRRSYFERRDDSWRSLLPYRSSDRFAALLLCADGKQALIDEALTSILAAINRGEGLSEAEALRGAVALQVRAVEGGTIRSYRVFPRARFSLHVANASQASTLIERLPNAICLSYSDAGHKPAELLIHLDLFEMFAHLNAGYLPTIEEMQGCYLSLSVFKNLLSAAPYQELLLSRGGRDVYRITREPTGRLIMHDAPQGGEGGLC